MTEVKAIGRGIGLWVRRGMTCRLRGGQSTPALTTLPRGVSPAQGDMVITLRDGAKIEIRSIDRWQEIKKYIEDKIAEAQSAKEAARATRAAKE